jgi:NADPH2:quinone reductase
MRAWQVQGKGEPSEVLHQVELPAPEPATGQVQVRVTAAGVGLPDVLMCRGTYPLTPPLPFTPGQEMAGVVSAVGDGVDLAVGTRVMSTSGFVDGNGSFAEYTVANAAQVFPVPDALDDASAAGFWIPHLTGWIGLVDRGQLKAGDWLAVLGAAGGSGIAAVQLGKALGAKVVAVVGDDQRAEFCRGLGADATLVARRALAAPGGDEPADGVAPGRLSAMTSGELATALREATGGRGVDLIYDPVGGAQAEDAFGALARGGRLLAIGFASGSWPAIHAHRLVVTNTSLVGVLAAGLARDELEAIHASLSALLREGRLRNAVTERVPFDDLPSAVQRLADRAVLGKLVVNGPGV